jgi:hypothetical protein
MYLTIAFSVLAAVCGAAICGVATSVWMHRTIRKMLQKHDRELAVQRERQRREHIFNLAAWIQERQDPDAAVYPNIDLNREVPIEMLAVAPDQPVRLTHDPHHPLIGAMHRALFDDQNLTGADFQLFQEHELEFTLQRLDDGIRSTLSRRRARAPVDLGPALVDWGTGVLPASDPAAKKSADDEPKPAALSIWKRLRLRGK